MAGLEDGGQQFAALARRLKETGEVQLRKDLYKAINDAARPVAREIASVEHLKAYMPDRYAEVLAADLSVIVSKLTGRDPGVSIRANSRAMRRRVRGLDDGKIRHPLFGDRERWFTQLRGMKPGFFTVPCGRSGPEVRDAIVAAMRGTIRKITSG